MSLGFLNAGVANEHRADLLAQASRWRRGREARRSAEAAVRVVPASWSVAYCARAAAPVHAAAPLHRAVA
jgi:hypothetical protein